MIAYDMPPGHGDPTNDMRKKYLPEFGAIDGQGWVVVAMGHDGALLCTKRSYPSPRVKFKLLVRGKYWRMTGGEHVIRCFPRGYQGVLCIENIGFTQVDESHCRRGNQLLYTLTRVWNGKPDAQHVETRGSYTFSSLQRYKPKKCISGDWFTMHTEERLTRTSSILHAASPALPRIMRPPISFLAHLESRRSFQGRW
jgi:hypothetical protein